MINYEALCKTLQANGYEVSHFATAKEAADYLDGAIDGVSVGFGGSVSLQQLELYPRLSAHNEVIWHWEGRAHTDAIATDVYVTSVNGLAETGEIINIDGTGNRVSSTMYGHKKVYLVVGSNKIAPDYDAALWRARNIAAPLNARRLNRQTPCALSEEMKCYNCNSPDRICRALTVLWSKPSSCQIEVVLVDEELGY